MQHFGNISYKMIRSEERFLPFLSNVVCPPSETFFRQANGLLKFSSPSLVSWNSRHLQSRIAGVTSSVTDSLLGLCCSSKSFTEMSPMVKDTGLVVVIMGVSGAGKSTIGKVLGEALDCPFLDADDFHPDSNKEKMSQGIPLSDEDRLPWLQVISKTLKEYITCGRSAVLACSALRNKYRDILKSSDPTYAPGEHCSSVRFVLLDVPAEVLSDRLNIRVAKGEHFMPPTLLKSQLKLLEIDASESVLRVDATQSPSVIVDIIQDALLVTP